LKLTTEFDVIADHKPKTSAEHTLGLRSLGSGTEPRRKMIVRKFSGSTSISSQMNCRRNYVRKSLFSRPNVLGSILIFVALVSAGLVANLN